MPVESEKLVHFLGLCLDYLTITTIYQWLQQLLTIHVRHVDSQFNEVGEVWVIWTGVADLSGERFSSNSARDTRLTHSCKELKVS